MASEIGLTHSQVAERVRDGKVNRPVEPPHRGVFSIVRSNALTPVNAIMLTLFVLVALSGHLRDGLFVGVVLSNTIVGIAQELKARHELRTLQVLTEPKASVVRSGEIEIIDAAEVVVDDVLVLAPGEQVIIDGTIVSATGLRLDESMLTGESEPVPKLVGEDVLSGSFVIAGSGRMVATAVGADSYAGALTTEAVVFDTAESLLRAAIDRILRWLTWIIPVASILLLLRLLAAEGTWQDALRGTVAAAVAMVPDGLVLLTSLAFVAGVLELSRRNALAKQLSTVEVLARVDVLCVDKTGTITTGNIGFDRLHPLCEGGEEVAVEALRALAAADGAPNASMLAISSALGTDSDWRVIEEEPFSSTRKWSAVRFAERGWIYLGAPDVLLGNAPESLALVDRLNAAGQRLLALAKSDHGPHGDHAPTGLEPLAIVELRDEVRADAKDTFAYFAEQSVTIKVISGDNPDTVAAISKRAGLLAVGAPVDARTLVDDPEALAAALRTNDIFGRVAPHQKQDMVRALQKQGHVVAMTGDGVNDILALKDADLGIAMGSGSPASRAVADLILTDDAFASLPVVVNEGRKVINNVERVANLFVSKAVYAVLLTALIGIAGSPFPFLPRQLTLIGTFSIGIPGFFLALAPETGLVKSGFLDRVLRFSVPAGAAAGAATFVTYEISRRSFDLSLDEARTLATITLLGIGLAILVVASRPLRAWKFGLAAAMAASYGVIMLIDWTRSFFELHLFTGWAWAVAAAAGATAAVIIATIPRVVPGLRR